MAPSVNGSQTPLVYSKCLQRQLGRNEYKRHDNEDPRTRSSSGALQHGREGVGFCTSSTLKARCSSTGVGPPGASWGQKAEADRALVSGAGQELAQGERPKCWPTRRAEGRTAGHSGPGYRSATWSRSPRSGVGGAHLGIPGHTWVHLGAGGAWAKWVG